MKFFFLFDVIISVVMTIGVVVWLNPYTSSVWPTIGACLHLLIRGLFCKEAWGHWTEGSAGRWYATLSGKEYYIEIPASLCLALIHGFLGYVLWNGFYGGMSFFVMWAVSQILEFVCLKTYELRTRE